MKTNKKFLDTRTGKVVTQFKITEAKYMQPLTELEAKLIKIKKL